MSKFKADRSKREGVDLSEIPELGTARADAILEADEILPADRVRARDLFSDDSAFTPDIDTLMVERAVKYPNTPVRVFLRDIKGYTDGRIVGIMAKAPSVEWEHAKVEIRDKLTETVVKRHIDLLAEVQESHITASKLGLAKALEMLTKMRIEPAKDKHGEVIYEYADGEHKPKMVYKGFSSKSLLECMQAIEKAQLIYRRAMGLPNDEGGLQQILNAVQINLHPPMPGEAPKATLPENPAAKAVAELSYDDVMVFIEHRRALDRQESENAKNT